MHPKVIFNDLKWEGHIATAPLKVIVWEKGGNEENSNQGTGRECQY